MTSHISLNLSTLFRCACHFWVLYDVALKLVLLHSSPDMVHSTVVYCFRVDVAKPMSQPIFQKYRSQLSSIQSCQAACIDHTIQSLWKPRRCCTKYRRHNILSVLSSPLLPPPPHNTEIKVKWAIPDDVPVRLAHGKRLCVM